MTALVPAIVSLCGIRAFCIIRKYKLSIGKMQKVSRFAADRS